jgi:hypothetical protein
MAMLAVTGPQPQTRSNDLVSLLLSLGSSMNRRNNNQIYCEQSSTKIRVMCDTPFFSGTICPLDLR